MSRLSGNMKMKSSQHYFKVLHLHVDCRPRTEIVVFYFIFNILYNW